jgi:hypothetical protein
VKRRVQNVLVMLAALTAAVLVVQTQTDWLDGRSSIAPSTGQERPQTP